MKRVLTTIAILFVSTVLFSQSYYRYQDKKIDLKVDSTMFVIQTDEQLVEKQNSALKILLQNKEINFFQKMSNNCFLIVGNKSLLENYDYFSNVYRNVENGMVIILPRIVVKFKQGVSLQPLLDKFNGKLVIESRGNQSYILKCDVAQSQQVLKMVNELDTLDDVIWCEPEFLADYKINNTLYPQQYYLKNTGQNGGTSGIDINIEPAWNITNGNPCITVAVIDDGVDRNHEDMGTRVLEGFTIRNATGDGEPQNANSIYAKFHGMACAGIIAASNNTIGIRGVASNVNVLPVNIVPDAAFIDGLGRTIYGFGTNIEIAQAINWAWRRADVLSCSWGGGDPSNDITAAIDSARVFGRNGNGSIVVFASGNSYPNFTDVTYPAYVNGVITVGAINNQGTIWNYSQRGTSMDLVAPSGDISLNGDVRTTDRMGTLGVSSGNYLDNFGGTSATCPQVAGVAALMLSVKPDLSETQVRTILQQTATDISPTGFDNTYGYGRINAYAAVQAASPFITGPSIVCSSNSSFTLSSLPSGATCTWSFSPANLITPYSGNDTIATFHGASCSLIGEGTLTFTYILPGCDTLQITKQNILINGPNYSDIELNVLDSYGQEIPEPSLLCPYTTYHLYLHNNSSCSTSNYTWEIPSGWTLYYTYNDMASINTNDSPWGNVVVKAQTCCTSCGSNVMIHSAYFSEAYDCGSELFILYPNPAGSYVDICIIREKEGVINSKPDNEFFLTMTDINGVVKFIDKFNELPYKINTANFQNGIYIIKIVYGGKPFSLRFLINH